MAQKSRPWFSSLFSIDRLFGFKEQAAKVGGSEPFG